MGISIYILKRWTPVANYSYNLTNTIVTSHIHTIEKPTTQQQAKLWVPLHFPTYHTPHAYTSILWGFVPPARAVGYSL